MRIERRNLALSVIGVLFVLYGLKLLLSVAAAFGEASFSLTAGKALLGAFATVTGYAVFRGRRWWWKPFTVFAVSFVVLAALRSTGYGLPGALAVLVITGALWAAVGAYVRTKVAEAP